MTFINKAVLSLFSIFSFSLIDAQNKLPFGVVKAQEGYAMVRVHKEDYRKIVDKIRMKKGDVFVYVKRPYSLYRSASEIHAFKI